MRRERNTLLFPKSKSDTVKRLSDEERTKYTNSRACRWVVGEFLGRVRGRGCGTQAAADRGARAAYSTRQYTSERFGLFRCVRAGGDWCLGSRTMVAVLESHTVSSSRWNSPESTQDWKRPRSCGSQVKGGEVCRQFLNNKCSRGKKTTRGDAFL